MAIAKMQIVNKIGKLERLDDVIRACCRSGCFQPEYAMNYLGDASGFVQLNEENPYTVPLAKLTDILTASNHKPKKVDFGDFEMSAQQIDEYINQIVTRVGAEQEERASYMTALENTNHSIEQLSHFLGLDINLDELFGSSFVSVRFGRIPVESYERLQSYDNNPYVMFFPCSHDDYYYWGMYVSPVSEISEVDRIFASLYFERLRIPSAAGTPEEAMTELTALKEKQMEQLKLLDASINEYWDTELDYCYKVYSYLSELSAAFDLRRYAVKYNDSFIFTGWVPKKEAPKLKAELDKVDGIEYSFEDPSGVQKKDAPTLLKNNGFVRPYEFYVKMYGTPGYDEVDPTFFVGIVYTIIFGIMFADVGQGIILAIAGFLMWKIKKMGVGPILIRCGCASAVFGLVFGSVFGYEHVLDPVYKALFGWDEKPIEPLSPQALDLLIGTVGIGALLIIFAMLINVYSAFRRHDLQSAVFSQNGVAGILFYGYLVVAAVTAATGTANLFNPVLLVIFVALPLLSMYFQEVLGKLASGKKNWKPEKIGDYLIQNFFEVFEYLLSYLSNTISFVRVGAFVLVHASMMLVVFKIAELLGPLEIPIVIFGNIFVIALEGLLVSIQTLRLMFYEMFSRFFEGTGRSFEPVSTKTDNK